MPIGWNKKINGVSRWICSASDAPTGEEADKVYEEKFKQLWQGAKVPAPRRSTDPAKITMVELGNDWLNERRQDRDSGQITAGYFSACQLAVNRLMSCRSADDDLLLIGARRAPEVTPDDFTRFGRYLRSTLKSKAIRRTVRILISFINHCDNEDWIDRPIKVGKKFRTLANAKDDSARRAKFLPPDGIKKILTEVSRRMTDKTRDSATATQFYAMMLLAINGGFGQKDLAELPRSVVDLENRRIDFRRGKTREDRIVPLWQETIDAISLVLVQRPGDPLLFRTREGNLWVRETAALKETADGRTPTSSNDNATQYFKKIAKLLGVDVPGDGFYVLRHTHRTITNDAGDETAANFIMGHALAGSAKHYVHFAQTTRGRQRLENIVRHVWHTIFIPTAGASRPGSPSLSGVAD